MSADGGNYSISLSRDHKPNDENETKRIVEGGGKIYQYELLFLYFYRTQTVARIPGLLSNMGSPMNSSAR
jgi:hypothetical protein